MISLPWALCTSSNLHKLKSPRCGLFLFNEAYFLPHGHYNDKLVRILKEKDIHENCRWKQGVQVLEMTREDYLALLSEEAERDIPYDPDPSDVSTWHLPSKFCCWVNVMNNCTLTLYFGDTPEVVG